MALGDIVGGLLSGIQSITTGVYGARNRKQALKNMQQAIDTLQNQKTWLEGIYGDAIQDTADFMNNLNARYFAQNAISEANVAYQQSLERSQAQLEKAGLGQSGASVSNANMIGLQNAEQRAGILQNAQNQATQMRTQYAGIGTSYINNIASQLANAYAQKGGLQGQFATQDVAQANQSFTDFTAYASSLYGSDKNKNENKNGGSSGLFGLFGF